MPAASDRLRAIIGPRVRVRPVFQPIVDLESRQIIGYEALARFPDLPDSGPAEVFARARAAGVLADLDWECRRAAIVGAMTGGLRAPTHLFVNVEPSVLGSPPPWKVDPDVVTEMVATVPTVIELTERALLTDPAAVLWAMDWARERSCLVALDDLGANPDSVAMLDVVRPDIIKLDRSLLADVLSTRQRRTLRAVWDHVAHTGAHILCEGIESERDLDRARTCGASLAQGFHLGRPDKLALSDAPSSADGGPTPLGVTTSRYSSEQVTSLLDGGRGRVSPLKEIARTGAALSDLRGDGDVDGCVLLSLHDPGLYTTWLSQRYADLARSTTLVGIIGVGENLPPGVRGARVQPMRDHFAYVSVDPEFSVAIVGRDLGDSGPFPERRFEWVMTHDDAEVTEVARSLIRRLSPQDGSDAVRLGPADGLRAVLTDIATTAVQVIGGVETAGLTLRTPTGNLATLAASDQYPFLIDQLQQLYREGPSLQGAQDDPVIRIDDFEADGRWMSFRAAATVAAPVSSLLSFRLFTGPGGTGFLTLYSHEKGAFDASALENAYAVAGHAASVWTTLRAATGAGRTDHVTVFEETPLTGPLATAVAAAVRSDGVSPGDAMRSILDFSATNGTPLQQTARHMVVSNGPGSAAVDASDFGSAGST